MSNTTHFGTFRAGMWYEWAYTDRYQIPTKPTNWQDNLLPNFHEHFYTTTYQPYAEYELRLGSKWTVSGGVKYAYYKMDLTQFQDNGNGGHRRRRMPRRRAIESVGGEKPDHHLRRRIAFG